MVDPSKLVTFLRAGLSICVLIEQEVRERVVSRELRAAGVTEREMRRVTFVANDTAGYHDRLIGDVVVIDDTYGRRWLSALAGGMASGELARRESRELR